MIQSNKYNIWINFQKNLGKCIVWYLWLVYIEDLITQINHLIYFIFHLSADLCCKFFFLVNKLCINFFLHFLLWAKFEKFYEIESISLRFMAGFGSYWVFMTLLGYFWSFQTLQLFKQINVKSCPNTHPVKGFRIWTFGTWVVTHNH